MWLVRDTCTAREQHLHGSRATLVLLKRFASGLKRVDVAQVDGGQKTQIPACSRKPGWG
ncbi:hypothetical protein [uncultured Bacteroides sp.]|uniref:hypothetical protein n=1 Tax=uncultured Bacteroides sp. TaxID=162156 RepID=UPI00259491B4|nr:hypothetical protein [uncultured Bacteroides sp.]